MRKNIIISLFLLFVSVGIHAIPARPGQWKTITLHNGTTLNVELCGDEHCSFWRAADGRCFLPDSLTDKYIEIDVSELHAISIDNRVRRNAKKSTTGIRTIDYAGTKKCLCILVEYPNMKFQSSHGLSVFRNQINGIDYVNPKLLHNGSVRDYFREQSYGTFDIDFDVVGPYMLANSYSYYGLDSKDGKYHDLRAQKMAEEAIDLADADVDYSNYDWDEDGKCEAIYVLYAGKGQADGGDDDTIWPHKSSVWLSRDDVVISDYACGAELDGSNGLNGIGTMCHEYSHCLGLPDMYDVDYECDTYGSGWWDIMSSGPYLDNGNTPCAYNAYERWFAGWLEPIELKEDTEITGMQPLSAGGEAYIMYNDGNRNEYYLLENRGRRNFDSALLGEGLLAYHVDYDKRAWMENLVNCTNGNKAITNHPRFQIVPADNDFKERTTANIAGDAYPYVSSTSVNRSLANNTTPGTPLFHRNSNGKYFLCKSVLGITKDREGNISFSFKNQMAESNIPEGALLYETFSSTYGCGGNDGTFDATTNSDISADMDGWALFNCLAGLQCIQIGTEAMFGKATTPEINVDGSAVLTFRAASVDLDNATLKLSIASGDATLSVAELAVPRGQWKDFSVTINGNGKVKVALSTPRALRTINRVYVDDILVMPATDGIMNVKATEKDGNGTTFTLAGQRVSNAAKNGIYIRNGRKVLK